MARLEFVDASTPGVDAALVNMVKERRGGELLNLDKLLLHSAPLARGWNAMFGAIRTGCILDGGVRELVILLVAILNRAPYEFAQHAPVALEEGVPQSKIDALANWAESGEFNPRERDALAYATAMTLQVQVPDDVFANVRRHFGDREMVELTATIAGYNMVSRFLEAMQIEVER
ncbi:carboxymuconolactone decarboxylase family protein [Caenimonas koreensis DSM 17982]|uniref:Carboxymuconolactone decarboxylase family protein n=1 Tax=Caenimonas koreensis DSM 17982 TaxID=1121255 RepID=A0A844B5N6_9BURK|nr:carboxymuconolactone decarboxylase family protein [Caenimonas koreensis]MRD46636.1 carboxymuconolactone decarboxylase family protein [Caenimonas koreensis DSM 17982]